MAAESGISFALEMIARTIDGNNKQMNARLDRFEDAVGKRFDAQDAKLEDICDEGKAEHRIFVANDQARRDDLEALRLQLFAIEHRKRGRAEVWEGLRNVGGLVGQYSWVLLLGAGAAAGWIASSDVLPAALAATQPEPMAIVERMRPARRVALIPPTGAMDPAALRGPLDDQPEAWQ